MNNKVHRVSTKTSSSPHSAMRINPFQQETWPIESYSIKQSIQIVRELPRTPSISQIRANMLFRSLNLTIKERRTQRKRRRNNIGETILIKITPRTKQLRRLVVRELPDLILTTKTSQTSLKISLIQWSWMWLMNRSTTRLPKEVVGTTLFMIQYSITPTLLNPSQALTTIPQCLTLTPLSFRSWWQLSSWLCYCGIRPS